MADLFPYRVVLSVEDQKRHLEAAKKVSGVVLQAGMAVCTKPYEVALGLYLATSALCKEYGWDPRDFHLWVANSFPAEQQKAPIVTGPPGKA